MTRYYTKLGHPVQGAQFTLAQGDVLPPTPVTVVGKGYGPRGNSHLVMVWLEFHDEKGGRGSFDWPIEAAEGAPPVTFTPGWPAVAAGEEAEDG